MSPTDVGGCRESIIRMYGNDDKCGYIFRQSAIAVAGKMMHEAIVGRRRLTISAHLYSATT